ncbi:endonuclease/exonuclease/phosphatase family protein [Sphingobacterium oryzagri]|uniref:Endonuclease/exonuclease/phosphatase family protein n=1 Tax=Sphingobacterium oryzagri TaxID=3025669 RepID=A0ABY7WLQ8_9SPHI|nr:endonuclease/exonuclease/phosphatase family protein [Sphingobacterium sp. KACC 22765]WDF69250.1 endonuclease/exonuclease/phosphatase family protein [Sphingobacterium sp. KACC 22765]
MKKNLTTAFLLLCCFASFAQRVAILSFNIHHGNPPAQADSINLEAVAKVIQESGADLVGIQEVDVRIPRSNLVDQGFQLAKLTGMHYFFSKGIDFDGGEYGTLILSRHKIVGNRRYDLPMLVPSENRSLAIVDVQFPNGKIISFANVHLDLNEENKIAQAEYITELGDWYDRPLILVGDFNTEPGGKPLSILANYFTRNTSMNSATYPSDSPTSEIDYIMLGKQTAFSWKTYKTIPSMTSDHLPVFAEIIIK